jgi:hypothetical protein
LERIDGEAIWLGCPALADELVRGEALERFQAAAEVVGGDEVCEVDFELPMAVVVEALDGRFQEGRWRRPSRLLDQLNECELAGPIDRHIEVQPPFGGLNLRDVDVEVADRVRLELPPGRLVAVGVGQPGDAVTLETAVQR